jgi:hypothetical protein
MMAGAVRGGDPGDRSTRPGFVALVAGLVAAIYLVFAYMAHPLPSVFGVEQSALAASGGMRMKWVPPQGADTRRLEAVLRGRSGSYVDRDGDAFVIAVPGVARQDIHAAAQRIAATEGLVFREVVPMQQMPGTEEDRWSADDGGIHVDYYFTAPTREEVVRKVDAIAVAEGTSFAFEKTETGWRSYVVRSDVELDGWSVASATASYDQYTGRPIVLVDFDDEGARRFAALTSRIVGNKLAIMVRGDVKSAPIIMGAIRGGRASITMGAGDEAQQTREQQDLIDVLRIGALPPGGRVVDVTYAEPKTNASTIWLVRFVIGVIGGLLVGLLVFGVVRWARPLSRVARRVTGPLPWQRIAVTLVAPAALILVEKIAIYGVDGYVNGIQHVPIGSLGIAPFMTATVLVEIFAVIIPGWRARRHAGEVARLPITMTAALVTVALVCYQGWMMALYLDAAQVMNHGLAAKILVIGSVAGGTMILLAAAAIVRWKGLGNGYGALLAFGFVISLRGHWESPIITGEHVVGGIGLVAIALAFGVALRWRVAHRRIPSSSFAPLADAGGVIAIAALLSSFPITDVTQKAVEWSLYLHGHTLPFVGLIILMTYLWSFAFARPVDDGWWRATVLSAALLVLVGIVVATTTRILPGAAWLVDAISIAIAVAYALDAYADLQAHRQKLVLAWTLHQPHAADHLQDTLAAADIPSHMASTHLRTLFSFFGPFVPIDVYVAPEHVERARQLFAQYSSVARVPRVR